MSEFSVSLIIPAYNESKRLAYLHEAILEFKRLAFCKFEVILVNDGSTDDTAQKLNLLIGRWKESRIYARLITYEKNKGKGGALKEGVQYAQYDFILTLDIDMSTRPSEIIKWHKILGIPFQSGVIYIGDRKDTAAQVSTRWYRKFAGQIFNLFIDQLIDIDIKDTQCGFKLYPAEIGKLLFRELIELGWAHDVEILLRAKNQEIRIKTLPVNWVHRTGAKISVIVDGLKMVREILKIRTYL